MQAILHMELLDLLDVILSAGYLSPIIRTSNDENTFGRSLSMCQFMDFLCEILQDRDGELSCHWCLGWHHTPKSLWSFERVHHMSIHGGGVLFAPVMPLKRVSTGDLPRLMVCNNDAWVATFSVSLPQKQHIHGFALLPSVPLFGGFSTSAYCELHWASTLVFAFTAEAFLVIVLGNS